MFFLSILSIQCKIKHDRLTETRPSTGWPALVWGEVGHTGTLLTFFHCHFNFNFNLIWFWHEVHSTNTHYLNPSERI